MAKKKKICRHCGEPMIRSARICPNCGGKNPVPFFSRWYVWAIIVVLVVSFARLGGGDANEQETNYDYYPITVDELYDALDDNALKAEDTFQDACLEVTGVLSSIDSDGEYFGLYPLEEDFSFEDVHCKMTSDEQREKLKEYSKGDTITVKGVITDIGEIAGYTLTVDSIE